MTGNEEVETVQRVIDSACDRFPVIVAETGMPQGIVIHSFRYFLEPWQGFAETRQAISQRVFENDRIEAILWLDSDETLEELPSGIKTEYHVFDSVVYDNGYTWGSSRLQTRGQQWRSSAGLHNYKDTAHDATPTYLIVHHADGRRHRNRKETTTETAIKLIEAANLPNADQRAIFYAANEARDRGMFDTAISLYKRVLASNTVVQAVTDRQYSTLLNLAALVEDQELAWAYLSEAIWLCPERAEARLSLVMHRLTGDNLRASLLDELRTSTVYDPCGWMYGPSLYSHDPIARMIQLRGSEAIRRGRRP
jgi:tetratricopeptide (TPR) repeat protein